MSSRGSEEDEDEDKGEDEGEDVSEPAHRRQSAALRAWLLAARPDLPLDVILVGIRPPAR